MDLNITPQRRNQAIAIAGVLLIAWLWFHRAPAQAAAAESASIAPVGGGSVGSAGSVSLAGINLQSFTMPGYGQDTSGLMASLQSALTTASEVTASISAGSGSGGASDMFPLFGWAVSDGGSARSGVPAQSVAPLQYVASQTAAPRPAQSKAAPARPSFMNEKVPMTRYIDGFGGVQLQSGGGAIGVNGRMF